VNCATLVGDSAMSTLFGHSKGAFTGAIAARTGYLKSADNGILFLDEIGELGLDEQAMLLKALEDKSFFPVGSDKEVQADFQLIAGTNRDLREEVRAGRFREDLWARLKYMDLLFTKLKDRVEDIEPNITFELQRFAVAHQRQLRFHTDALRKIFKICAIYRCQLAGIFVI
jgi:transcriptional regulatory protein RtcR